MSSHIKTPKQIKAMRESAKILAHTLNVVTEAAVPGVSTWELDQLAEKTIIKHGGIPGFKGYSGFPGTICPATNEIVVHGIPRKDWILQEGDIFTVDCGVIYEKMNSDAARSIGIGQNIPPERIRLIQTAKKALKKGIEAAVPGNHVGDISRAIEKIIDKAGYYVVEDLTGHGIGETLHEKPYVYNYFAEKGMKLQAGMTLAIEPIFGVGTGDIITLEDDWTIVTADGSDSVQQEETILITENGAEILTKI